MKKFLILLLAALFTFTACEKDDEKNVPLDEQSQIQFKGELFDNNLKSTSADCYEYLATHALVEIDGQIYQLDVYYLEGIPYTTIFKTSPGVHVIGAFVLYHDPGTPDDPSDDIVVAATPEAGADYSNLIDKPVEFEIIVEEFKKVEIEIEVVCFEEDEWDAFGFFWFRIQQIVIRQECFFGDICTKNPDDYLNTPYENQSQGLQLDMPAIFRIDVFHNGDSLTSYCNMDWFGEGAPLCIEYPDYLGETDEFELRLFIALPSGNTWAWFYYYSWFFTDESDLLQGDDGIVDFAVGYCSPNSDFIFEPWIDLPPMAVLTVGGEYYPGNLGTTFDINLSGIGSGFDIYNGTWGGWCADQENVIYPGTPYNVYVYSSLQLDRLPEGFQTDEYENKLKSANWLFNNCCNYGYDVQNLEGDQWDDLQDVLWNIFDGTPVDPEEQDMFDDACCNGPGWCAMPGCWAAVLFIDEDYDPNLMEGVQILFVVVDP